jgi:hypothetical protein
MSPSGYKESMTVLRILATWEAEIKRILIRGQPQQIVFETSSSRWPK